jgi:hypothetical protein
MVIICNAQQMFDSFPYHLDVSADEDSWEPMNSVAAVEAMGYKYPVAVDYVGDRELDGIGPMVAVSTIDDLRKLIQDMENEINSGFEHPLDRWIEEGYPKGISSE